MVYAPRRPREPGTGKNRCHYCGERAGATIDHIVPRAMGGPDARWNFVNSCQECNGSKSSEWPTCECSACTIAVDKFLSDPALRDKAIVRLFSQCDNWTDGIEAKHRQIVELENKRAAAQALILTIKLAHVSATTS